jgi:hypothetical protein
MFTNPVQPKQVGSVSIQSPVVDTSAQTALAGVSDLLSAFGSMNQPAQVNSWEVKEQWETEGHSAAIEDAKQYQFLTETAGRTKADQWLNKQTLVRQGSLGASSADSYRQVLGDTVGKTKEIVDRELEHSLEKKNAEKIQELEMEGRELLLADMQKYGGSVDSITSEMAIGTAMARRGVQARTADAIQQNSLTSGNMSIEASKRKLASEVGINTFVGNSTSAVQTKLSAAVAAMKANPAQAEQIKVQFIADITQLKTLAQSEASKTVLSLGGDPSDVGADRVTGVTKMYDDTISLIRGDFAIDVMKANMELLSYGVSLETLQRMDRGFATQIYLENTTRMPITALDAVVKAGKSTYTVQDTNEVIRRSVGGLASASVGTSVPHAPLYKGMGSAVYNAGKSEDVVLRTSSAEALLNSLQETYQAPAKVRSLSSRPDAVPALFETLARSQANGELGQELVDAAAAEGSTPLDIWIQSSTGVLRNTIAPSLMLEDPNVMGNLDLKYSGGKFKLTLNEEGYRKAAGFSKNPGYYSGIDQSMTKINRMNSNLRSTEKFLNDAAQSYSKTTGSSADDVGLALYEVMNLTFNLTKPTE